MLQAKPGHAIGETDVEITSRKAWDEFYAANEECLTEQVGDEAECLSLALNGKLFIGGGAAPITHVHFTDITYPKV